MTDGQTDRQTDRREGEGERELGGVTDRREEREAVCGRVTVNHREGVRDQLGASEGGFILLTKKSEVCF